MELVQLNLVAPDSLEDDLLDVLLAHPEWAAGFTLLRAEGHSLLTADASAQERVRGRARRVALQIVLDPEQARALLTSLGRRLPKPEVAWWLTPVLDFGRLA
jgi:hypothetical protein